MPDLTKTYLFRMTHIENVPHILEYGITHVSSEYTNESYKAIGDNSIISSRNSFILPNGKRLGDYIPFYFGPRMPMLYVIQKGYNSVPLTPAKDIVYCISSVQIIVDHQLPFVFTDGHAIEGFSEFYEQTDLPHIDSILDQKAISELYWRKDDDLDLKRRKQAEFLVESDLPITAIIGWGVYDEDAKNRLLAMGIKKIVVKPNYYY